MQLLIGIGFKLGFVRIFHFPITRSRSPFSFPLPRCPLPVARCPLPVARCPFSVSRFPFPVPRSLFRVPGSSFPVSRSLFAVSRSSFLVAYSLFLVLVKSLRSFRKSECSSYYPVVVFFYFALPASQCHGRYVEGLYAWRAFTPSRESGRVIIILPLFSRILKQEWILEQRHKIWLSKSN